MRMAIRSIERDGNRVIVRFASARADERGFELLGPDNKLHVPYADLGLEDLKYPGHDQDLEIEEESFNEDTGEWVLRFILPNRKSLMPTREESMLRQVAANAFRGYLSFEELFVIDKSLPEEVTRQIATPADAAAALDCWRNMMVAAIDEVVERLSRRSSGPSSAGAGER